MRQFATDQFKGGNEGQCFGKKSNANFDSGFIDQSGGGGGGSSLVDYAVTGNIDNLGITLYISASGTSRMQTTPNPDPQDWSTMRFYPAANSGYAYAEGNSATLALNNLDEGKAIQVAENVYKVVSNDFDDDAPTLTIGFLNEARFTLLMESKDLDPAQSQWVDFNQINMRISDIYLIDGEHKYIAFTIEDTMNRLIPQTTYSQCYPTFEAINVSNNQHPHRVVVPANFTITTESE